MDTVYTIGHSTQPGEHLASRLQQHAISAVVDIRSTPFSGRHPSYNQPTLRNACRQLGIHYLWMQELGGRPSHPTMIGPNGKAAYHLMIADPALQTAWQRIKTGCATERIALLCSEGDPRICHRHRLLWPQCLHTNMDMQHILMNGELQSAADIGDPRPPQLDLFTPVQWWSLQPVNRPK